MAPKGFVAALLALILLAESPLAQAGDAEASRKARTLSKHRIDATTGAKNIRDDADASWKVADGPFASSSPSASTDTCGQAPKCLFERHYAVKNFTDVESDLGTEAKDIANEDCDNFPERSGGCNDGDVVVFVANGCSESTTAQFKVTNVALGDFTLADVDAFKSPLRGRAKVDGIDNRSEATKADIGDAGRGPENDGSDQYKRVVGDTASDKPDWTDCKAVISP